MKGVSVTPEKDMASLNRLLVIILHLTSLLCKIEPTLTQDEQFTFKKLLYDLVKHNPRGTHGYTLLHLACSKNTTTVGRYPVCSFPTLDVVRLLIDVGAPVNAVDNDNNTALHIATSNAPCKVEIVQMLLKGDAHHDACNQDRKTPFQLLSGISVSEIVSPLQYVTLQCLAAKCIVEKGIAFEEHIPIKMQKFVKMH